MTDDATKIRKIQETKEKLLTNIKNVIVGQEEVLEELFIAILAGGHVLLEGVPGLAKTLMITSLAKSFSLDFKRIQFTPDLMPSDIIGTEILELNRSTGEKEFKFLKGPLFSNIILADEINRTPPKTQAALLQAMQEHEVSVGNTTFKMQEPFFVLATQNPIEQEGTYPLPEAQLDRFLFNLVVDYPTFEDEIDIVKKVSVNKVGGSLNDIKSVLNSADILELQQMMNKIPVTQKIIEFAVNLVRNSRPKGVNGNNIPTITKEMINWGAGPRASLYLVQAAKIYAIINGRLTPEISDIIRVAKPVLRHRILPNFRAEAEGISSDDIIEELIKNTVGR